MPTSFTRLANVVFQDELVDTKTMKITFVAPLQVVVAMLQDLSTRPTIDCVMRILRMMFLDNEHKVFCLNISSVTNILANMNFVGLKNSTINVRATNNMVSLGLIWR